MIGYGRTLVPGAAGGDVLAIAPLSFWGGFDPQTGLVIDRSHPALGRSLAGRILVMPAGRGSSSSSSVLAEAIRLGTAPAAILLAKADPIIAVGAMVAMTLYSRSCPIVVLAPDVHAAAATSRRLSMVADADGARIQLGLQGA